MARILTLRKLDRTTFGITIPKDDLRQLGYISEEDAEGEDVKGCFRFRETDSGTYELEPVDAPNGPRSSAD